MTRLVRRLLIICGVALVAACGGGSGGDTVVRTDADQTVVAGTLSGLGGVTVDGVTYGDAATTVALDVAFGPVAS